MLGKYGDEGERLIFKILKSGNFLKGLNPGELDFKDALSQRINLLNCYPLENIFKLNHKIRINDGAKELVEKMKAL